MTKSDKNFKIFLMDFAKLNCDPYFQVEFSASYMKNARFMYHFKHLSPPKIRPPEVERQE